MKVFIENQRFNQWWLHLTMVITLFSIIIPLLLNTEKIFSNKDLSNILIPLIIIILVYSFILSVQLKTRIDEKGIHYQFFPIWLKLKLVPWSDLDQCYCRSYRPLSKFGGYSTDGKALNIRGKWGVQLVFNNGKKLFLGTQKPEDVKNILKTYNKKLSTHKLDNSI